MKMSKIKPGQLVLWLLPVAMIGVAGYWYFKPHTAPSWVRERVPGMLTTAPAYKWRDDKGNWHITDKPPEHYPYETLTYRSDANVIPSNNR